MKDLFRCGLCVLRAVRVLRKLKAKAQRKRR